MLMMIGPVKFEVIPFNTDGYDHSHESGFAEKPVLGARPPLEFVGEGPEGWTIKAKLFPDKFGGMGHLKKLYQARKARVDSKDGSTDGTTTSDAPFKSDQCQ